MDENKKMLYIIPRPTFFSQCSGVGGHISHLYGIVQAFSNLGWNVDILIADGHSDLIKQGYSVLPEMKKRNLPWLISFHLHIKKTVDEGTYSLIYMRYSALYCPFIPSIANNNKNTPLILEINSFGSQRYKLFKIFDKRCLMHAHFSIVISKALKDFIVFEISKKLADNVFILTNGVDPNRFNKRSIIKTDGVMIGYIGVLKPDYGLESLLNAFVLFNVEFPQSKLIIVGDGPHKKILENFKLNKNISFIGAVKYNNIPDIISTFDILVYTTSLKNRFQSPIKIYEYMCTHIPIIAAKTELTSALIPHRKSSLLYEISDNPEESINDLMIEIIKSPLLGKQLSASAYNEVTSHHTWDKKVEKVIDELKNRELL